MIVRVTSADVCGDFMLRLVFNDGTSKVVDLEERLRGPVFEPLRDPAYFRQVTLDPICGTIVWPNGADIAPETLHDMQPVEQVAT